MLVAIKVASSCFARLVLFTNASRWRSTVQAAATHCFWSLHIRIFALVYTDFHTRTLVYLHSHICTFTLTHKNISTCTTFCYYFCLLFLILLLKIATAASRCVVVCNSLCLPMLRSELKVTIHCVFPKIRYVVGYYLVWLPLQVGVQTILPNSKQSLKYREFSLFSNCIRGWKTALAKWQGY